MTECEVNLPIKRVTIYPENARIVRSYSVPLKKGENKLIVKNLPANLTEDSIRIDIDPHAKIKIILTPEDFRRRSFLKHHAFGGTVPHLTTPPPPHKTPINGLWYVGAQSESGGGVAGVVAGTRKAILNLLKEI